MTSIEAVINGPTNKAVCDLAKWIKENDKLDHIHYGCSWHVKDDGIYHVCVEEKRTWKL